MAEVSMRVSRNFSLSLFAIVLNSDIELNQREYICVVVIFRVAKIKSGSTYL